MRRSEARASKVRTMLLLLLLVLLLLWLLLLPPRLLTPFTLASKDLQRTQSLMTKPTLQTKHKLF